MGKWAKKGVEDETKRERVLELVEAMGNRLDAYEEGIRANRGALFVVDSRHSATADDYRKVFRKLDKVWDDTESALADLRFRLKKELTREQWDAMFERVAKKTGRK
jgi:hypothetical protein